MKRRGFMVLVGSMLTAAAYLLSPLAPSWLRIFESSAERDRRLADLLRQSIASLVPAGGPIPPPATRSAEQAARALLDGLSDAQIDVLLRELPALRTHIRERGQADWVAGRSSWVGSWLLSQTEIDVAVLAGTAP
jgi:hypothetical protein